MKHSKISSAPRLRKRQFLRNAVFYLPSILFASLLGTYLDLYFVEKHFYEFPIRPFPDIFSINIAFTLIILPLLTCIFLYLADKMSRRKRLFFTLFLSGLVPFIEIKSVELGFFYQGDQWNPLYSVFGYFFFLIVMWKLFIWCKVRN